MPRVIAPVLAFAALVLGQTTGSVEGTVVDRVTGAGIPGASITFYIRTQAVFAEATTDASGEFRIFSMKPGSYEVRFEKEGYRFGNKIPAQPYIVGETPSPVRIRLEMTRMVTLSGRVVDPDGNPMSQGEVNSSTATPCQSKRMARSRIRNWSPDRTPSLLCQNQQERLRVPVSP